MKAIIYYSHYGRVEEENAYLIDRKYYVKRDDAFYLREMTKDRDYGYFINKRDAIKHAMNYLRRDIKKETKMLEKLNNEI